MNLKRIKPYIIPIILTICITTIVTLSTLIFLNKELKIDFLAYNILVEKLRTPPLTKFMKIATSLSNTPTIITLALISTITLQIVTKEKKIAAIIPINLVIITTINQILKFIFQRERPTGYRLIEMTGYSFPSGHAMVSMVFYGLIIYLIAKLLKNRFLKIFLIIINILIILSIGISRVYLGVHYLSDVIMGYSISLIYLFIVTKKLNQKNIFP